VGAKAEQLFISSILRQEDHVTPLTNGVTKNWFSHYQDQWEWIARYIESRSSLTSKFSRLMTLSSRRQS
jgi:hypothetical protein